jgi:hypothetical protein
MLQRNLHNNNLNVPNMTAAFGNLLRVACKQMSDYLYNDKLAMTTRLPTC